MCFNNSRLKWQENWSIYYSYPLLPTPLLIASDVRSKVVILLVVVVNGDKVSFVLSSFAIISQREKKREGVGVVCFTFILFHVLN